ncbi:MAG TPA: hypothetical protein VG408_09515 [Actinomycetota bacterium]|nr:hypothetical protein [Actinomycetota bacterium]
MITCRMFIAAMLLTDSYYFSWSFINSFAGQVVATDTLMSMEELLKRRVPPYVALTTFGIIVCAVVIQIPDSFLTQLERNRPLTDAQAGWAYRLIAFFAIVQIVYGGFSVFRIERVQAANARDRALASMTPERMVTSLSRTAAGMVVLTLTYGLATIAITGLRGGFWLFPLLCVAQAGWYYREIGQIAGWRARQPALMDTGPDRGPWKSPGPGHVPALARGMRIVERD